MNEKLIKVTASTGLLIGGILGMVGSFLPSASLRSLAWSLDGIGLIIASALLAIYYLRKGYDGTAAGFLIFTIGKALILSSSGIDLDANVTSFAAGAGLWAASLALISSQKCSLYLYVVPDSLPQLCLQLYQFKYLQAVLLML